MIPEFNFLNWKQNLRVCNTVRERKVPRPETRRVLPVMQFPFARLSRSNRLSSMLYLVISMEAFQNLLGHIPALLSSAGNILKIDLHFVKERNMADTLYNAVTSFFNETHDYLQVPCKSPYTAVL